MRANAVKYGHFSATLRRQGAGWGRARDAPNGTRRHTSVSAFSGARHHDPLRRKTPQKNAPKRTKTHQCDLALRGSKGGEPAGRGAQTTICRVFCLTALPVATRRFTIEPAGGVRPHSRARRAWVAVSGDVEMAIRAAGRHAGGAPRRGARAANECRFYYPLPLPLCVQRTTVASDLAQKARTYLPRSDC